jgi:hypothetical protein
MKRLTRRARSLNVHALGVDLLEREKDALLENPKTL